MTSIPSPPPRAASIVIPCFNEREGIVKLVEALRAVIEHCQGLEFILVDNGSTDDSYEVMKECVGDDPYFKLIKVSKNRGYGYGILRGLEQAEGTWIGWLHADLQIEPQTILEAIEIGATKDSQSMCFIKGLRKNRPLIDSVLTIAMASFESLLFRSWLWDINAQPTLMHRNLYEQWICPPHDFSLDLYSLVFARRQGAEIERFSVMQQTREFGESSWNRGFKSRIALIGRTVSYSLALSKSL
jgi:polyisoprenyl-phosphate glycosyltransferase